MGVHGSGGRPALPPGATVAGKVGIGTTLVVAGEKAGSKVSEARKLGIRVIGEAEFVELIGGG